MLSALNFFGAIFCFFTVDRIDTLRRHYHPNRSGKEETAADRTGHHGWLPHLHPGRRLARPSANFSSRTTFIAKFHVDPFGPPPDLHCLLRFLARPNLVLFLHSLLTQLDLHLGDTAGERDRRGGRPALAVGTRRGFLLSSAILLHVSVLHLRVRGCHCISLFSHEP